MSEAEQALKTYEKISFKAEAYERLSKTSDFQVFRSEVEDKIERLRDLLETEEKTEIIKGRIMALRELLSLFDATISHRKEIESTKKALEDSLK